MRRHHSTLTSSVSIGVSVIDWFERLTGFRETTYAETRARLSAADRMLRSSVNGGAWGVGALELASLAELRVRAAAADLPPGRPRVGNLSGDIRILHRQRKFAGALFQVASQFNMLEMTGPDVTPEDGVTRYQYDRTQGPACAIAAGAATIWRNYFAPTPDAEGRPQAGQTAARQLDGLADLGAALARDMGCETADLWTMRNGYALPTREGLTAITDHLAALDATARDALGARLRIGLHTEVEVTDTAPLGSDVGEPPPGHRVGQAFCSALPVAYSGLPAPLWRPFAELVLDAAYEATLLAAALTAARGGSRTVLLTRLGGGAFGNGDGWIDGAMWRALGRLQARGLDVVVVSYGAPPDAIVALEGAFGG